MARLQLVNLQSWRQRLNQLLGLTGVVDNQGVQVSGTSDLELGLSESLTGLVQLLVDLDGGGLNVGSSGQFQEFLDVSDLSGHCVLNLRVGPNLKLF